MQETDTIAIHIMVVGRMASQLYMYILQLYTYHVILLNVITSIHLSDAA